MIIRKRILKIVLIGFIFASIFFTWYINKFLGPTVLKKFFIKRVSEAINRPISLKSVRFSLIQGFVLNEPVIFEPDGKTVFLKADRISTTFLFIPLFRERKVIIPSVHIYSPSINIIKKQDTTWNFLNPVLIKKGAAQQQPTQKGFGLLIQRIHLDNGEITFLDNTRLPAYSRQLINLGADVAFSLKENAVNFKTQSQLNTPLKTGIGLDGSYLLDENTLMATGTIKNLALSEAYDYFRKDGSKINLNIKEGISNASFDVKIDRDKNCTLDLNSSIRNLDISSFDLTLKGDMGINGIFNFKPSEPPQLNYKVELDLAGPTLSGVYLLNELSNLRGKIEISNSSIGSAALEGNVYNMPLRFNGGIDLKNMLLKGALEGTLDLSAYKNFLPEELKQRFNGIDAEGPAEVNIKFFDRLKDPQPAEIDAKLQLKGAGLKIPNLQDIVQKIFGEIRFKNNVFYISRTSFDYGTKNYILDAKIINIESPDVKMKLKNKELSLDSRFQALKDNIHVMRLAGKYLGSRFDAAGDIQIAGGPNAVIRGKITLDTADLRKIFTPLSEPLTRFNIRGICDLDVYLNGPLNNPKALEIIIKGKSDVLSCWDLNLNTVKLDLRMKDGFLLIPEFSARPYNGAFFSTMEINLAQENPPYAINLALEHIDLNKLVLDTGLKDKKVSGEAICKTNIRGYGKNLDTIKGEGFVFIKGGRLWEIPLLKGLADVLFIPNLSNIVFDEASMNFAVANRAILTSDLKLHSQNVGLLGEGSLYFDGRLDLLVISSISENFIRGSSEFERLASTLLAEAGQFIGRIKIGGTIKKPEYKLVPFPLDKILKDKLKELLGGFF